MRSIIAILLAAALAAPCAAESDGDLLREALWPALSASRPPDRPVVGLALSGGGARGFAHAGVLQVLEAEGFPCDRVAGTSMGSVIGALYASGASADDIWRSGLEAADMKVARDFRSMKLVSLLLADKLIRPEHIDGFIGRRFGGLTFDRLKVPFACTAMDLRTGEEVIFSEGAVDTAVRASVNLPGLFAPVHYRHRYLVDGGVVDFIPVDVARGLGAQWVLASVTDNSPSSLPGTALTSLLRVIDVRGSLLARQAEKKADFVIRPEVAEMTIADFDKCGEAGAAGVSAAFASADEAKEALLLAAAPCLWRPR